MPSKKENISSIPPTAEPIRLAAKAVDLSFAEAKSEIKIKAEKKRGRFKMSEPAISRLKKLKLFRIARGKNISSKKEKNRPTYERRKDRGFSR